MRGLHLLSLRSLYSFVLPSLLVILVSIPLLLPFFHSGYFPTHDGEWAVVRLADMYRELKDVQIPARFSGNLNAGYGYPLFNFAYPFPYYLGVLFVFLKFGFVGSIKILFASSVVLSGLGMFVLGKALWKSIPAGIVSAVLYLYFPYRFVDLFVRGSLGESMAFALFPWILFCLFKMIHEQTNRFYFVSACVLYAMLITTHNIMALLFSFVLLPFLIAIVWQQKKKPIVLLGFFFVLSYGLAAFFWIPAILEKQYVLLSQTPIADRSLYFLSFQKILFSPWGYGIPTAVNSFTLQIGWPQLGIVALTLSLLVMDIRKTKSHILPLLLVVSFLSMLFLLFPIANLVWEVTPLLSEINYPWTLLSQIGLVCALLAGYLFTKKMTGYGAMLLALLAIVLYMPYAKPELYVDRTDNFYVTNDATTTSSRELMPLWVKQHPTIRPGQKVEIIQGKGILTNISHSSKHVRFMVDLPEQSVVQINTIYYPGWHVIRSGMKQDIQYTNTKGVMQLSLPPGKHAIDAQFKETPLRLSADVISLFSLGLLTMVLLLPSLYTKLITRVGAFFPYA